MWSVPAVSGVAFCVNVSGGSTRKCEVRVRRWIRLRCLGRRRTGRGRAMRRRQVDDPTGRTRRCEPNATEGRVHIDSPSGGLHPAGMATKRHAIRLEVPQHVVTTHAAAKPLQQPARPGGSNDSTPHDPLARYRCESMQCCDHDLIREQGCRQTDEEDGTHDRSWTCRKILVAAEIRHAPSVDAQLRA